MRIYLKSSALIVVLALSGCNDDNTSTQNKPATPIITTNFEKDVVKLPEVDPTEDSKTILGVDTNENNIPDRVENIAYQGVSLFTSKKSDYNALLPILKMVQPQDPAVPNSIDRHKIYCAYMSLSSEIKNAFPLSSLYRSVLNNKARSIAFKLSLKEQAINTDAEVCHD